MPYKVLIPTTSSSTLAVDDLTDIGHCLCEMESLGHGRAALIILVNGQVETALYDGVTHWVGAAPGPSIALAKMIYPTVHHAVTALRSTCLARFVTSVPELLGARCFEAAFTLNSLATTDACAFTSTGMRVIVCLVIHKNGKVVQDPDSEDGVFGFPSIPLQIGERVTDAATSINLDWTNSEVPENARTFVLNRPGERIFFVHIATGLEHRVIDSCLFDPSQLTFMPSDVLRSLKEFSRAASGGC